MKIASKQSIIRGLSFVANVIILAISFVLISTLAQFNIKNHLSDIQSILSIYILVNIILYKKSVLLLAINGAILILFLLILLVNGRLI